MNNIDNKIEIDTTRIMKYPNAQNCTCGFCKKTGDYYIYHMDFVGSRFCSEECALKYAEKRNKQMSDIEEINEDNYVLSKLNLKEIKFYLIDLPLDDTFIKRREKLYEKITKLNDLAKERQKC